MMAKLPSLSTCVRQWEVEMNGQFYRKQSWFLSTPYWYNTTVSLRNYGSFCEYWSTDDVKQKKQKAENKTTPNKT